MEIRQNDDKTLTLSLIPDTRKEFNQLNSIWKRDNVFEKKGCCIHASAITQHGIENSDFTMLITPTKRDRKNKACHERTNFEFQLENQR